MIRISLLLCIAPVFSIIVRDPPPSPNDYKYSYDIQDATTGDHKSQHEVRQGDLVTGAYTVVGPDGTKRTVEYTADPKHGFKAVLSEEPVDSPPVTQPPVIQESSITSFDYNALQYDASTTRPAYIPLVHRQPKIFNAEEPAIYREVYFTPQNQIEPEARFESEHYFIPANKY